MMAAKEVRATKRSDSTLYDRICTEKIRDKATSWWPTESHSSGLVRNKKLSSITENRPWALAGTAAVVTTHESSSTPASRSREGKVVVVHIIDLLLTVI